MLKKYNMEFPYMTTDIKVHEFGTMNLELVLVTGAAKQS